MQRYMRPSPTLRQRLNCFEKDFTAFKDHMFHIDSPHFSILFIIPRICIAVCIYRTAYPSFFFLHNIEYTVLMKSSAVQNT